MPSTPLTTPLTTPANEMRVCTSCECSRLAIQFRVIPNGDESICRDCYRSDYSVCQRCDDAYHMDNMNGDYCDDCYSRNQEEEENSNIIQSYGSKPDPQFKRVPGETASAAHVGWELEVEKMDSDTNAEDMAEKIQGEHIYFKEDGSISDGFEIVSHPMTELWIKRNKAKMKDMLKKLKDSGYKSYQTTTCGMHIHISKSAFNTYHLYRFMRFFYDNPKLILLISQRREAALSQWAKLGTYDNRAVMRMANKKFRSSDRYTAVNLTAHTAEVRIFRGTLHEPSFSKNLEFVLSLHKFTSEYNATDINPARYFDWVKTHRQDYRNLNAYFTRKSIQLEQATGYLYDTSTLNIVHRTDEQTEI